jgi:hypothetical protein
MIIRFSSRSLLLVVLLVAFILSVLRTVAPTVSNPEGPPGEVTLWLWRGTCRLGGLTFWLTLLMPWWFPTFFVSAQSRALHKARPYLALAPAAWYCFLIILHSLMDNFEVNAVLAKIAAGVGTVRAIGVLIRALPGPFFIFGVPLGAAIVSGTVWFLIATR